MTSQELEEVVSTVMPFVSFLDWIDALVKIGDLLPIDTNDVIAQASGGGGSHGIRVGDFTLARKLICTLKARYPDAPCWSSEGWVLPDPELHLRPDRKETDEPQPG